jgi:hypothetical protein
MNWKVDQQKTSRRNKTTTTKTIKDGDNMKSDKGIYRS